MSHTVKIKLNMTDFDVVINTAKYLGLKFEYGSFKLFSSTEEGLGVYLPGWKYPIVIKKDGTIAYDNFNGSWGNMDELKKFQNRYTIEKTKKEARKKGYSVVEKNLDGKTRLILKKT